MKYSRLCFCASRDTWCNSRTPCVLFPLDSPVACIRAFCVYLHARRCSMRYMMGAFAYWWHHTTNTRGRRVRQKDMHARGARHYKRMLIIFTSCNSVTLNHRQATLCLSRNFSALLSFSFSRYPAIAITTDAATCDPRENMRNDVRNLSASPIFNVANYEVRTSVNCHMSIAANSYRNR